MNYFFLSLTKLNKMVFFKEKIGKERIFVVNKKVGILLTLCIMHFMKSNSSFYLIKAELCLLMKS